MRVLHIVPYFPPERLGGVGEFVARLHRALLETGHDSLVLTRGKHSTETVLRIAETSLGWFLRTALWARRTNDFDIVHFQAGEGLPLLLRLALRRRRQVRTVATFHVSYAGMSASLKPYRIADRTFATGLQPTISRSVVALGHRLIDGLALRLADGVNTISAASAKDVLGPAGAESAHVIYYGLDPVPHDHEAVEPVELLYVGSPGHRKRINSLPFVLEAVHRKVPGARLRIFGFELDDQPEFRDLLRGKHLLSHVECLGVRRSEELPPYYASAKALLVPSAYEGLPLVVLEAMQCGLPVIATNVSGHPEAIRDGENGFLVDLDQPQEMAERAIRVLQNPDLGRRLGRAAQETIAEHFGMARHLNEYLSLYRHLCSSAGIGSTLPTGPDNEGAA